nr:MAG TPA: hypothetical protein [Caudoviricetes sp.]
MKIKTKRREASRLWPYNVDLQLNISLIFHYMKGKRRL